MSDADVIAAIRKNHLKANISEYMHREQFWAGATVDRGGTIFGPGPYVHLPVRGDLAYAVIRVYAPARLRRRLAQRWKPGT